MPLEGNSWVLADIEKLKNRSRRLGQDARKYDSKDGVGRGESGTETENNAYAHGWAVLG